MYAIRSYYETLQHALILASTHQSNRPAKGISDSMVNLTIDGKQITVSRTATIYEAALEAGVHIPVLCYAKKLLPFGACRVV